MTTFTVAGQREIYMRADFETNDELFVLLCDEFFAL
jgi:hypothetical protein